MKQVDQELHDAFYKNAVKAGIKMRLALPGANAKLPFGVIAYTSVLPQQVKSESVGSVNMQVDIYGSIQDRKLLSDTMASALQAARLVKVVDSYEFRLMADTNRIIKDDSTSEVLYHGILDLTFAFRKVKHD